MNHYFPKYSRWMYESALWSRCLILTTFGIVPFTFLWVLFSLIFILCCAGLLNILVLIILLLQQVGLFEGTTTTELLLAYLLELPEWVGREHEAIEQYVLGFLLVPTTALAVIAPLVSSHVFVRFVWAPYGTENGDLFVERMRNGEFARRAKALSAKMVHGDK